MATRHASCSCGQLALTCEGDPLRVSMCHCLACQKRTGSVFGVQARYARDKVTIEGRATEWVRIGDSGGRITYKFCAECGATVCWEIDGMPGMIAIAVGAFADPTFGTPTFSVYEARKHAWVALPDGVEHMD